VSPLVSTALSIESDDAIVSDASGVIEINPEGVESTGTTRWRYRIALKTT
jgi:hypothetical protein